MDGICSPTAFRACNKSMVFWFTVLITGFVLPSKTVAWSEGPNARIMRVVCLLSALPATPGLPDSQPCLTSCVRAARGWILTFYHHTLSRRPCPRNSISTQDRKCPPAVLLVVGEHDPVLLPASGTSLYSRTGRQERPTRTSCYLAITVLTSACISDCCIHYYRPHASCVRPLWTAPSAGELSAGRSRYVASVRGPASTTGPDRGEMPGRREHRAGIVAGQRSASIHLAL